MGTNIRPQLSLSNPYHISKNRFYELKHFCLQYKQWKEELKNLDGYLSSQIRQRVDTGIGNPVQDIVTERQFLINQIQMVQQSAHQTDSQMAAYILKSVTEQVPYRYLNPPCCKDVWYELYHRFFATLDIYKRYCEKTALL